MPTTFSAEATQYLLPGGRSKGVQFDLPVESEPAYQAMLARGYRLEAEVLTTGQVSMTISDPEEDLDFSITPNGPEVAQGIVEMLARSAEPERKDSTDGE